jgi:hypothetical protein
MKKVLVLFVFLLLPVFVYADSCSIKEDTQTDINRTVTCDSKLKTTTKYSSSKEETVLNNGVCTIKCTENLIFSIDPIKKVLSGTSFNYPLYVSGERKCTAVYDYTTYETTISKLVADYASLSGAAKTSKGNELSNYYGKKKECDEFAVDGSTYEKKYTMKANVSLKVATSTKVDNLNYSYKNISDYNSVLDKDEIKYYACNYNEADKTCSGSDRTLNGWIETARIFGKYTMPNTYIERYTGEVKTVSSSNTCNAGDRYFVNFNELTKPIVGATGDNGYTLTLTANNVGNNLISGGEKWNLNVNCWYQVKNLFFPQGTDDNFDEYGNTAFSYRQIDLNDPFPEREPGANWYNKTELITSTAKDIDKLKRYSIVLDGAADIRKIKEYNENNPYVTFKLYLNKEDNGTVTDRSYFIDNFYYIVNRIVDGK